MKRFELSTSPWQGDALPLSYIRKHDVSRALGEIADQPIMHDEAAIGQHTCRDSREILAKAKLDQPGQPFQEQERCAYQRPPK